MFQADPAGIRLSTLTNDAELQRIFRRIEDDGADEVVPIGSPRAPIHGGQAMTANQEFICV